MKTGHIVSGIGVGLALLSAVGLQRYLHAEERKSGAEKTGMGRAARTPILVELFTSEGCSSCPSADKLLATLATTQPITGAEIIALEEHVDYWDHIGWKDPFSNASFTKRQYDYGAFFHLDNVYTPQAVVDGQREFVGSDKGTAVSAISEAVAHQKADVEVKIVGEDANRLRLNISVGKLPTGGDATQIMLAVAEDNLKIHVGSGENSGRNLVHHGVVRYLQAIGKTQGKTTFSTPVTLLLDRQWRRENLRIVAFAQSENSRHIVGAGTVRLTDVPKAL